MSYTIIRPKDRNEWLEHRKSGIGSSEVATQEIYKAGELGIPVLTDQKTIGRTPPARHPKRKER